MIITEGNEIQDSQIIQNTKVEHGSSGMIRMVYPGADGDTLINSEWFNEQEKRRALLPWLAAVRQALVSQGEEKEAVRRATVRAARSAARSALAPSVPSFSEIPTSSSSTVAVDPLEFVRGELLRAKEARDRLMGEVERRSHELMGAQSTLQKWQQVADSLGIQLDAGVQNSSSVDSPGIGDEE